MSPNAKLWVARVVSVPILIMLPIIAMIPGLGFLHETRGDSMPLFGMLGFFAGGAGAIVLASRTLFARRGTDAAGCFRILAIVASCEAMLWLSAYFFITP